MFAAFETLFIDSPCVSFVEYCKTEMFMFKLICLFQIETECRIENNHIEQECIKCKTK